jgi:uncharacterized membrane protein
MDGDMYTIIGGDGKEYGPVTLEQVRAWIAAGRANLQTRAKVLGSEEWRTIADIPELTAPGAAGARPVAIPAPGARAPVTLDVMSCYARSWALLTASFWQVVGASFLVTLAVSVIMWTHAMGTLFLGALLNGVLAGGLYHYFLLRIRGQTATVADAFAGFTRAFGPLLVAGILVFTFKSIGFLCLLLPGIYLTVAYSFAYILVIDGEMGAWEAMETSRRVITRQWWSVFGLILLGALFIVLGAAAFGVGVFVAIPLVTGAIAYAYEDLCRARSGLRVLPNQRVD